MSVAKLTYFQNDWLKNADLKDWLLPADKKTQARCKRCRKTFELSNMGVQALKSHAVGKKHKKDAEAVACFFKKPSQTTTPNKVQIQKQSTLEVTVNSDSATKAEIMWALNCVSHGYSGNSCAAVNDLFQSMFPDSEIAKEFKMGANKIAYILNFGIASYFQEELKGQLEKSDCFVSSFDESLNDVTQTCQMELMVRYWDINWNKVKVRYWNSKFLGHTTHTDLLHHFNDAFSGLDMSKMIQVSMDGPTVNWKLFEALVSYRSECELPQLINIGSCGLHVINGAFRTGAEATSWDIKGTLKGIFQILHESPARREDYESVTGAKSYPLYFCATRWVESKPVADRAVEIWPEIRKLMAFWEKLPKSKQPKCKSFLKVQKAVHDPTTVLKLEFFSFIAGLLEPYLLAYQTDSPMIPFMYEDLQKLVTNLLKLFVKSSIIESCASGLDLKKIDLFNKQNLVKNKDIVLGFAADTKLSEMKRQDIINDAQAAEFRKGCGLFLVYLTNKIFERSPLGSVVVRTASIFNPKVLQSDPHLQNEKKMKRLLNHLVNLKLIPATFADKALSQFSDYLLADVRLNQKFIEFDRKIQRLEFFFEDVNIQKHKQLSHVLKIVLTLSHGQASVERGFIQNKTILLNNMTTQSIVVCRFIKDHLIANNLQPHTVNLSNKLIVSVKSARQKYHQHLSEVAEAEQREKTDNARKILEREIEETKVKREQLVKTCEMLDSDFVSYVEEAEKKQDMKLISKANALKRRSEEKKEEIKKLEEAVGVLEEKKKRTK